MGKTGGESKKRKSTAAPAEPVVMVPLKVEQESAEGDTTGALLACFADAPPPAEVHGKGQISLECSRTPAGNLVLTAETGRLELRGEEPPRYQQPFKYVIGMYDPEKKRVVILDQDRGVFPLVRSIKGMGDSGKSSALSKEQARDQLVSAFGSKRVRRTHQERKGVQLQADSEETLSDLHQTLTVKKEEAQAAKEAMGVADDTVEGPNELAPAANMAATRADEVYGLESLLSTDCWTKISSSLISQLAEDKESADLLPQFCRAQIPNIAMALDEGVTKARARLLTYIVFLVNFSKLSNRFKKNAVKLKEELGVPIKIGTLMLDMFAVRDGESYTKPEAQRHRLLLHLATAALIFCDFDLFIDELASDLKLKPERLADYFKELGAKVTKPRGATPRKGAAGEGAVQQLPVFKAELSLPLTFPKRARGGPK